MIKEYFLSYNEALLNDFVLSNGGKDVELWKLRRQRHRRLAHHVRRHGHAVDDRRAAPQASRRTSATTSLPRDLRRRRYGRPAAGHDRAARASGKTGRCSSRCARCSTPTSSTPTTTASFRSVEEIRDADVRINGGFFVFRRDLLDYIEPGEELVDEPFARLIEARRARSRTRYDGFWEPMDTIKDKQRLDALARERQAPWRSAGSRPRYSEPP